jgi:hypothetical protein
MGFWPFRSSGQARAEALLDVRASSVAGGFVVYREAAPPVLAWGKRAPIIARENEAPEAALGRTLDLIAHDLATEGAPVLARVAGAASIRAVRVALDAPWQETEVRQEEKREERPVTFTRRMLAALLTELSSRDAGAPVDVEEHLVSIRLNGYQTAAPFGKRARRITLVVLISRMRHDVIAQVTAAVKRNFHLPHATCTSGPALRFEIVREAFPHERDALVIDAADAAGTASLVRAGALATMAPFVASAGGSWVEGAAGALRAIATAYPLPHTIFLIAAEADDRARELVTAGTRALWLSDDPPTVTPITRVAPEDLIVGPETLPDIRLALMARYWRDRDDA